MVIEDAAHFGFAFNPSKEQALRVVKKARQPLELLLCPQSELAASKMPVSMRELIDLQLALPMPSFGIGTMLRETEAKYGIRLPAVLETDSLAALRNFVREDIGSTILPAFVVAREIADGQILTRPIDIPELNRGQATILTRTGRRLPRAATRLLNHCARGMSAFRRQ
jgi:DNA-binding transcriptional LysR family regulator